MTDPLTSLPNANALESILQEVQFPNVFIFDIQNFKKINLQYGDECGDAVLKKFAALLEEFAASKDMSAFRAGDDEFVLLSQKPFDLERIEEYLIDIPEFLQDKVLKYKTEDIKITYHMGISIDYFNTLEKAKIALKVAKAKDQEYMTYSEFAKNLLDETANDLKNMIKEAIEEEKITPYFQPIFDKSGKIEFHEILTRFDDIKNLQSPVLFFKLADKFDMYEDLLRTIVRKVEISLENVSGMISMNIDKLDVEYETLFDLLVSKFKDKNIIFEISLESFDKKDFNTYAAKLKSNNIKVLIDNVQYIDECEGVDFDNIDFIKLHPNIIREVNFKRYEDLLEELKGFGKKIIAAGINSTNSYEIAKKNDLDYFQGFLLECPKKDIK